MLDRLTHTLASNGVPIDRITGVQGNLTVLYMPWATPGQITAGDAMIASFDWSQSADDAWRTARKRANAIPLLSDSAELYKVLRGIVQVTMDELNILRAETIGVGTLVFDPPNVANGTGATSANITVTGAAFGDFVSVAAPYSLAGIIATGYVSAPNTVNIRLHNGTGAAVNLASGTWKVVVSRLSDKPPRTLGQAKTSIINAIIAGSVD